MSTRTNTSSSAHASAWYHATRAQFLADSTAAIANQLAGRAADENLELLAEQQREWRSSVALLQEHLARGIPVLRNALLSHAGESVQHVILEFDFRRRGLRMDCVLIADGVLFVVEFKRNKIEGADRDQVMNYCVNLIEFHEATRDWCESSEGIVVPLLCLTEAPNERPLRWSGLTGHSWPALARRPLECDGTSLQLAIATGLEHRRSNTAIESLIWLNSEFRPSSTIVDAAVSLYGRHDVAAIMEHASPKKAIEDATAAIQAEIGDALTTGKRRVIFLSGAPGAGKTLVGLDLALRGDYAAESVFVTGNAPLVEVLNKALSTSYRKAAANQNTWVVTGYRRSDAALVISATSYKIVKAHQFLGDREEPNRQRDGRVLIFDEAQRTYEKDRLVLGKPLKEHEADLILAAQSAQYEDGGCVVVALVGHNQAINTGERGIVAWLEAADLAGWDFAISDDTLDLSEINNAEAWKKHPRRRRLKHGHLGESMRFYRNSTIEQWASAVLDGTPAAAATLAARLSAAGHTIYLTRSLKVARNWGRETAVGTERVGLIASGQARRLAAEGLFVDQKPKIGDWMLAPTEDIRSSNALETVQNQFQIQGLELDYCIVCWDADLRREADEWKAYKIKGTDWQNDSSLDYAKNGYRVLLTRARKGMVIFVPNGALENEDSTRLPQFYDSIAGHLISCGARLLEESAYEGPRATSPS